MLPVNNNTSYPCSNISSNCVIWQGPDIPCLNLCHGDTVSDVIAKLAEELCDLQTQMIAQEPDLSGLNLLCVLPVGQTAPSTLEGIIQLIIDYVCSLQSSTYTLPNLNLPLCLQYDDPITSQPVTTVPLDQFAQLTATKVCEIFDGFLIVNQTLGDHESRLITLENCVLPCSASTPAEVQVISSCLLTNQGLVNVSTLVLEIETAFCSLQSAVGGIPLINYAINTSGCITGSTQTLSGSGTYGSSNSWQPSMNASLAQMVNNLFVVICDMHQAIQDIQLNCCPSGCDSVSFGYTTEVLYDSNGFPNDVRIVFTGTSIPSSFTDCNVGTRIEIQDSLGATVQATANASSLQNSTTGVTVDVSTLNVFADLNIVVRFCVTDGQNTCSENISSVIPLEIPCPESVDFTVDSSAQGVELTISNSLGLLALYTVDLYNSSNIFIDQNTANTSADPITGVKFNDLNPNTDYYVIIKVTVNGNTVDCGPYYFNTGLIQTSCITGIELAILLDYTSSMGSSADELKAGAANLVTTLDQSSGVGNNYKIGLMLVDEVIDGDEVTYNSVADYTSLPTSQKVLVQGTTTDIHLTGLVPFAAGNGTDYQNKVALLNDAVSGFPMGSGVNNPDPTDIGIENLIGTAGSNPASVIGQFDLTSFNAKYLAIITDTLPSGLDDTYTSADDVAIQNFTNQCIQYGIRVFVLGTGASAQVWQNIATQTGGAFSITFDENTLQVLIQDNCLS